MLRSRHKAFTILESLIVLAILVIMVWLMIGLFKFRQEKAAEELSAGTAFIMTE